MKKKTTVCMQQKSEFHNEMIYPIAKARIIHVQSIHHPQPKITRQLGEPSWTNYNASINRLLSKRCARVTRASPAVYRYIPNNPRARSVFYQNVLNHAYVQLATRSLIVAVLRKLLACMAMTTGTDDGWRTHPLQLCISSTAANHFTGGGADDVNPIHLPVHPSPVQQRPASRVCHGKMDIVFRFTYLYWAIPINQPAISSPRRSPRHGVIAVITSISLIDWHIFDFA